MFGINKDLKIHFIGIGGIGMSGIAEILINLGYQISGSDISENANVQKLKSLGVEVFKGHQTENIQGVQLIVYSSAIDEKNPEIIEAKKQNLPIIKRAEMLSELMRLKFGIAIAGSHGKTTTTSFLSTILQEIGLKPTCIVGGIVKNLGGHAIKGDGEYLVAEADESDGSFLLLNPIMSVITNIDNDHLDYYETEENIEKAFVKFSNKIPFYGCIALNIHDEKSMKLRSSLRRPNVTYGIKGKGETADFMAADIVYTEDGSNFTVEYKDQSCKTSISLCGEHNILNAMAAISIAVKLGCELKDVCEKISLFEGVGRRFELLYKNDSMVVIDDYGHHPTELRATINTAKDKYPKKDIIAIFEPHRYSRTKEFWNEFSESFKDIKKAYIADIYPASEEPIANITTDNLINTINKLSSNSEKLMNWDQLKNIFSNYAAENTVILSMGAGSISKKTREELEQWITKN